MGLEAATYVADLVTSNPVGGSDPKSQGDDHLRLLKAVLQATFPGAVGALKFKSTDAGAGLAPGLTLWRDSASPAAADLIGAIDFTGEDSASNETTFARIQARIDDPVNGTEDGALLFQVASGGALITPFIIDGTGNYTFTSADAGAGVLPTLDLFRDSASPAAADFLASIDFNGRDAVAAKTTYARVVAQIADTTNGSEDGSLLLQIMKAGTLTTVLTLDASGTAGLIPTTVDEQIVRWDGTTGRVQGSSVTISDTGTTKITMTDAGASVGPNLTLFRDSASPAASDVMGGIFFTGKDSTAVETSYAEILSVIENPTNAAEAGNLVLRTIVAGTMTNQLRIDSTVITATPLLVGTAGFRAANGVFARAASGNVLLRPGGEASTTGEVRITTNGYIEGGDGSDNMVLANKAGTGVILLRPKGSGSATDQTQIANNGNMTVGGTVTADDFIIPSDKRLKINLGNVDRWDAMIAVKSIDAKHYTLVADKEGNVKTGFLADDFAHIPGAVSIDPETGMKHLHPLPIVALLWQAVKELSSR